MDKRKSPREIEKMRIHRRKELKKQEGMLYFVEKRDENGSIDALILCHLSSF